MKKIWSEIWSMSYRSDLDIAGLDKLNRAGSRIVAWNWYDLLGRKVPERDISEPILLTYL